MDYEQQERPEEDDDQDNDLIFIHIVNLYSETAIRLKLDRYLLRRSVRDFLIEHIPSIQVFPPKSWILLNLTRRTILEAEQPLTDNEIFDGDLLVFGPMEELRNIASNSEAETNRISFNEAKERIRQFRLRTHIPEWFMCEATDEEYHQLLAMILESHPTDERLPDRKLISDITQSLDLNVSQANDPFRLLQQIQFILSNSGVVSSCEARRLVEDLTRQPNISSDRRNRFIGNMAALHLSPAPDYETSIISLIKKELIQIGPMIVYTGQIPNQFDRDKENDLGGEAHQ